MVVAATVLLLAGSGCSRVSSGTARPDPHQPGTEISDDGYGIVAGEPDAPVQLELFTEPQCNHCADLQADFGKQLASYIKLGMLAVTYRPMVFMDQGSNGPSARVSNALFLAAGPDTSAPAFQAFVQKLWAHQKPPPSDEQIADMARDSGVGAAEADKMSTNTRALDVNEMANANFGYLFQINPLDPGTPTVYDHNTGQAVDIYDNNWLSRLMASA